jgi:hypothetical protein
MMNQQIHEAIGGWFIIFGNVNPDCENISPGAPCQAAGHLGRLSATGVSCLILLFPGQIGGGLFGVVAVLSGLEIGFGFFESS